MLFFERDNAIFKKNSHAPKILSPYYTTKFKIYVDLGVAKRAKYDQDQYTGCTRNRQVAFFCNGWFLCRKSIEPYSRYERALSNKSSVFAMDVARRKVNSRKICHSTRQAIRRQRIAINRALLCRPRVKKYHFSETPSIISWNLRKSENSKNSRVFYMFIASVDCRREYFLAWK